MLHRFFNFFHAPVLFFWGSLCFFGLQYCSTSSTNSGSPIFPGNSPSLIAQMSGPIAIYYGGTVAGDFMKEQVCGKALLENQNLVNDGFEPTGTRFFGSLREYNFKDLFTTRAGLVVGAPSQVEMYYYGYKNGITPPRQKLPFTAGDILNIDSKNLSFQLGTVQNFLKNYFSLDSDGQNEFYTFTTVDGLYDPTNNCSNGLDSSVIRQGRVGTGLSNSTDEIVSLQASSISGIRTCDKELGVICIAARPLKSKIPLSQNPISRTPPFALLSNNVDGLSIGNVLPTEFSQRYENNFPSLLWHSAPVGTRSFALTATGPTGTNLFLYNIPFSESFTIPKLNGPNPNFSSVWSPDLVVGASSYPSINGGIGWAGPDQGGANYMFTLYALGSESIPPSANPSIRDLEKKTPPFSFISKAVLFARTPPPFYLSSRFTDNGFNPNSIVPIEFTWNALGAFGALNNFPKLQWGNPPANTNSYVLIVTNTTSAATHLVLYDIPTNVVGLNKLIGRMVGGVLTTPVFDASLGQLGFTDITGVAPQVQGWLGLSPGEGYVFALYAMRLSTLPAAPTSMRNLEATFGVGPIATRQILDSVKIYGKASTIPLSLSSSEASGGFNPNGILPLEFSSEVAGGVNNFPALSWVNGPPLTASGSYALVVTSGTKVHGLLYNIPPTSRSLPLTTGPTPEDGVCGGCSWGVNYLGRRGWDGPSAEDRGAVTFRLYALANRVVLPNPTPADFEAGGSLVASYAGDASDSRTSIQGMPEPPFQFTSSVEDGGFVPYVRSATTQGAEIRFNRNIAVPGQNNDFPALSWSSAPAGTLSYTLIVTRADDETQIHLLLSDISHTNFGTGIQNVFGPVPDFATIGTLVPGTVWRGFEADQVYKFKIYALNVANLPTPLTNANYSEATFRTTYATSIKGTRSLLLRASSPPLNISSSMADGGFNANSSIVGGPLSTLPIEFNQERFGGWNIFPKITWIGGPPTSNIHSYVLSVTSGTGDTQRTHLLLHNIPNTLTSIPRIVPNSPFSDHPDFTSSCATGSCGVTISNSFGTNGWSGAYGPGPYTFRMYAMRAGYTSLSIRTVTQFETGGEASNFVLTSATMQVMGAPLFSLSSNVADGGFDVTQAMPIEFNSDTSILNQQNYFPHISWRFLNFPGLQSFLLTVSELSDDGEVNLILRGIPLVNPMGTSLNSIPRISNSNPNFQMVGAPAFNYGTATILDGGTKQWNGFLAGKTYRFRLYAMRAIPAVTLLNFRHNDMLTNFGPNSANFSAQGIIASTYIDAKAGTSPILLWSSVGTEHTGFASSVANPIMPLQYSMVGQGGLNHFPEINWSGGSSLAKSYVLTMRAGTNTHLLLMNIPATMKRLPYTPGPVVDAENNNPCGIGSTCLWGTNYLSQASWLGPSSATITQDYTYKIYAMSISDSEYTKPTRTTTISDFESGGIYSGAVLGSQNISVRSPSPVFQLRSSNLRNGGGFEPSGTIPINFNYDTSVPGQTNDFPGFDWVAPPASVSSYALVITDSTDSLNPSPNLILYDIPAVRTSINRMNGNAIDWTAIGRVSQVDTDATGNPVFWKGFEAGRLYRFKLYAFSVPTLGVGGVPILDNTNFNDESVSFANAYATTNRIVRAVSTIEGRGAYAPLALLSSVGSDGFDNNGVMPTEFTSVSYGGLNSFPEIRWKGGRTDQIKSYVLTVTRGVGAATRTHLILYDISPNISRIPKILANYPEISPDFSAACEGGLSCGQIATNSWNTAAWTGVNNSDTYTFALYPMTIRGAEYTIPVTSDLQFRENGDYNKNGNRAVVGNTSSNLTVTGPSPFRLTSTIPGFNEVGTASREYNTLSLGPTALWYSNSFPNLNWSGGPRDALSYVLIVSNKNDSNIANLLLYDIPSNRNSIPYALGPIHNWITIGSVETNTAPTTDGSEPIAGWTGFIPNQSYVFRLYALRVASIAAIKSFTNGDASEENFRSSYNSVIAGVTTLNVTAGPVPLTLWSSAATRGFDVASPPIAMPANFGQISTDNPAGNNDFPSLNWTGGSNEGGYVLLVTNTSRNRVHFALYNIPSIVNSLPYINGPIIEQGSFDNACLDAESNPIRCGTIARNHWNTNAWYGPNDIVGNRYTFTLYSLNRPLPNVSNEQLRTTDFSPGGRYSTYIGVNGYTLNQIQVSASGSRPFSFTSSAAIGGFNPVRSNRIPAEFNMSSTGNFPALSWEHPPSGTTNYTLIIAEKNPDESLGRANLLLYNIANLSSLPFINWTPTSDFNLTGGTAALNSFGARWTGFRAGQTYIFRLFALKSLGAALTNANYTTYDLDNTEALNGSGNAPIATFEATADTQALALSSSAADLGFNIANPAVNIGDDYIATSVGGNGHFPKISWNGGRDGELNEVSYVLAITSGPVAAPRVHLLLYNIPGTLREIPRLTFSDGDDTTSFSQGCTVNGEMNQSCGEVVVPYNLAANSGTIYTMKLYALNTVLTTPPTTPTQFEPGGNLSTTVSLSSRNVASARFRAPPYFLFGPGPTVRGAIPNNFPMSTIPIEYNFDTSVAGQLNSFPQLLWQNPPMGTRSFVMIINDNTGANFLMYDIPVASSSIPRVAGTVANGHNPVLTGAGRGSINMPSARTMNYHFTGFTGGADYTFTLYAMGELSATANAPAYSLDQTNYNSFETRYPSTLMQSYRILARRSFTATGGL